MTTEAALSQNDLERIERVIYKNGDDLAVSVSRSFERLEERIDAAESRLYSNRPAEPCAAGREWRRVSLDERTGGIEQRQASAAGTGRRVL